ncbi:MAG: fibronectin type III domain-containing protein [bacterium]|nr:fibronectin type III domain-containing protein [bacterium]
MALAALTPAQPAGAQTTQTTFVSNLGQVDSDTSVLLNDLAQSFTTGSHGAGYSLRSVDVEFASIDSGVDASSSLTASIYSESGGFPGSSLGALTNPASFPASTSDQTLTFTSAGIDLAANTTYFLVLDTSVENSGSAVRNTASNSEDSGALAGWSIADRSGLRTWNSTGAYTLSTTSRLKISLGGVSKRAPLVSNFGQANGGTGSLVAHDHAQAFTTGSNARGYDLTAIDLQFPAVGDSGLASKVTVTVNEDSGGAPGAVVATLTKPATITAGANSFTHAGLRLAANTTYWMVLDVTAAPSGTNTIQNTASDAEDAGASPGFSIADDAQWRNRGGGSWTTFGLSRKITIQGTAIVTQTFVANTGQSDDGHVSLDNDIAQAFTTGSNSYGYSLRSVDVEFNAIQSGFSSSDLTARIYTESSSSPGSSLGTLTNPASFPVSSSDQTLTFTSAGIDLAANTTYFLVIDMSVNRDSSSVNNTLSDNEDSGALPGWSIGLGYSDRSFSSTGGWGTSPSESISISLGGVSKTRTPEVSVTGGGGVTEGGSASFTLKARPAPAEALPVSVSVATTGDFGYGTALPTSVTIPAGETSATLTIATAGDGVDELDGSVTVTLADGTDYDLISLTSATVKVWDDDPPLVSNLGQVAPANYGLNVDVAQGFTTGPNPGVLTSVDVAFNRSTEDFSSKLTVTVNRDSNGRSNGSPGAVVATLDNPDWVNRQAGTYRFTHRGLALEANSRYWVVLDGTGLTQGNTSVKLTQSDAEEAGALPGWSIQDDSLRRISGSWVAQPSSYVLPVGVNGRLVPNSDGSYTVPFDWPLKPPGVGGGGEFRLLFITDDWLDATSSDIDVYDAFVQGAALDGHAAIRPYAGKFRVVGSTAAVDARDHTRTNPNDAGHPDVPIFWLNGQRVAANKAGFWSSTWENWAMSDRRFETGEPDTDSDWPWTGTLANGAKHSTNHLGIPGAGGPVVRGRFWTADGDTGPIQHTQVDKAQDHAFYGISPVFRVASTVNAPPQEPATLSNLEMPDGATRAVVASNSVIDRAQSFTTGNNGGHYRLNSVDIEFARIGDSDASRDLRVQVVADNAGAPSIGQVLATLANPSMLVSSTDTTHTFTYQGDDGSGLRLEPNTTYWVWVYDASALPGSTYTLRATASNSERRQGLRLPAGWSIGDGHSSMASFPNPAPDFSTNADSLKIGLNLGAAEPFVQFRTCEGTVSGNSCDTGWVVANYTRHDPPPTITLTEGGDAVTYQWQPVDPMMRDHFYVSDQVAEPLSHFGGYIGAGGPDRDRLMCHTGSQREFNLGDPIVYVPHQTGMNIGYGSTAGPLLDRHDGCPFVIQSIYEHETNRWRPVSVAAGQDSDAFDHTTFLIHSATQLDHPANVGPNNGYVAFPEVHVPLIIRDDDSWEQDLEFSIDDGATWTSLEDGGLALAFPLSLNNGRKAHYFWVRLTNAPPADQSKRIHITANFANNAPSNSGTSEYFRSYRVWLTSPAAEQLHTFRSHEVAGAVGSATVSRTPIQIEINVGDNFYGGVTFEVEGFALYERNDSQISTETPPKTVRTKSFSVHRTLGSCVGCQKVPGDLPDPVVDRVGEVSYANLSDSGIDLSWPRVVGAEGYQVRYWSTTSPFPGVPAEEAWFGAEPTDPAWNIRDLEPDTEYRAVVYYQDHGATQLSTASPVIRFTTLAAGSPTQAEPASVIVERVPEVSISAASGTITEGEDATFTVTVDPAPDKPLDVKVRVRAPAAWSVVDGQHLGERTVNVSTTGSATFTIPTINDARPYSNGMLSAAVQFGEGYRLNKFKSYATVYVANNDLPPPPAVQLKRVSDTTATVAWKPKADGTQYSIGWHEAFAGVPVVQWATTTETEYQLTGLDPKSQYTVFVLGPAKLGQLTVTTLAAGATAQTFTVDFETPTPNTSVPVISVTSDGDVTEGEDASFTVSANPAPDADLDVSVTVTQSGDYGAAVGQRTVTIPSAGYATLTVATTDDQDGEADGSVTVTVDADADGNDYLVSPTQGAATAAVADDDGPDYTDYQTVVDYLIEVRDNPANTAVKGNPAHIYKWNRVLAAIGYSRPEQPMPASEIHDNAAQWPDSAFHAASVYLTSLEQPRGQGQQQTPEISISAGGGVTEGGDAVFTLTASPAPAADLDVTVTVIQSGDYGATTGQRTVTVSTTGVVSFTVATTDDETDEADGSVTATLNAGSDYTVSATQGAATVAVADNDDPPPTGTDYQTVVNTLIKVRDNPPNTRMRNNPAHILKWNRVLAAIGYDSGETAMPASEIHDNAAKWPHSPFKAASDYLRSQEGQGQQQPEVNISGGSAVSEGGSVSFTLTASPAPTAPLDVSVTISVTGDFGVTAGTRTVTIPTSGSATLTLATTDDQADEADEADGTVTATLATGSGYTIGSQSSQTADVADNDDPPPMAVPVVNIAGGGGVTEGDAASFTLTASPAPASNLSVRVTVTASGDYGITTGTRTVTVPASGTATFTVATSSDQADEADGSVTVTLIDETTYDLGTSKTATVAVADDDDPPVVIPVVSVSGGSGITEGGGAAFTVTASPAPSADLDVTVTVTASGDFGAATGQRTVTVPTSGSVTFTVGTTDDQADEAAGSVTVTVNVGGAYVVSASQGAATVAVADNDDPLPVQDQDQDQPDQDVVLADCGTTKPTLSISSPEASRGDTTVDFEVTLDCKPGRTVMVLLIPVRDGEIGNNILVVFTNQQPTATITLAIGAEQQLGLAIGWASPGLANRAAQGTVTYID